MEGEEGKKLNEEAERRKRRFCMLSKRNDTRAAFGDFRWALIVGSRTRTMEWEPEPSIGQTLADH